MLHKLFRSATLALKSTKQTQGNVPHFQVFRHSTYAASAAFKWSARYLPPGPQTNQYLNEPVTPLVFVSAQDGSSSPKCFADLAKRFALRRYSCVITSFPALHSVKVDGAMMECCEGVLKDVMAEHRIDYPPVILSAGFASLVAETYISSNRASGLILIDPTPSVASLRSTGIDISIPEFDYEPLFPIAMVSTPCGYHSSSVLRQSHRFGSTPEDVDWLEVENNLDLLEKSIGDWLDQMGM